MEIDEKKCVGCGNCVPYCTMGVISVENRCAEITQEECVECHTCYRVMRSENLNPTLVRLMRRVLALFRLTYQPELDVCPTGALVPPELEWPRAVRRAFSDPTFKHESTGMGGRGTEEIKTNDVTGRLKDGDVGFVVELGRPGIGAQFRDIQKVSTALAPLGIVFESKNPVTALMTDVKTGKINEEVLEEKVLSAIIEFRTTMGRVPEVLGRIREVESEINTVCSVGIASKCGPDGFVAHLKVMEETGFSLSPNGKINLGLGRPRFEG